MSASEENAASRTANYSSLQSLRAESPVLMIISQLGREIDAKCWGMCAMRRIGVRESALAFPSCSAWGLQDGW
jgi:hypothetical protein